MHRAASLPRDPGPGPRRDSLAAGQSARACRSSAITLRAPLPHAPCAAFSAPAATTGRMPPNWPPRCSATACPKEDAVAHRLRQARPNASIGPFDDVVRMPGAAGVDARSTMNPSWPWSSAAAGATSRVRARWIMSSATPWSTTSRARDVQVRHQQWDLGKSFDTFCPMGPCIVTADELDGRDDARARLGQRRASARRPHARLESSTSPRSSRPARAASRCFPGDVIATGTPSGVGMGFRRRRSG